MSTVFGRGLPSSVRRFSCISRAVNLKRGSVGGNGSKSKIGSGTGTGGDVGEINGDRVDRPPCSGLDPYSHRHGSGCLPIIRRHLPAAPAGWRWGYGRSGPVWAFYLERIGGGGGHWLVVDCPTADTAGALALTMWAYCQGARHHLIE